MTGEKKILAVDVLRRILTDTDDFNVALELCVKELRFYEAWRWNTSIRKYPLTIVEILELKRAHRILHLQKGVTYPCQFV